MALLGALLVARPAMALEPVAAEDVVRSAIADATKAFVGGPFTTEEARAKIGMMVAKYADVPYEAEQLLGRYWRKAGPDQRQTFSDLLIPFFVATYGEMIDGAKSTPKIDFMGTEPRGEGILVHTLITAQGEEPVPVDWLVQTMPDGRTVITDLVAEDIGLVTTMRSDFTSVIRAGGGDMEALFKAMRKKIDGLETIAKKKPAAG
jgi:phospholipid transport system substrate-binding protein